MQSIAEEVVSSSGGGGKYITSGFSAYNGHSAIGLARLRRQASPSTPYAMVLGTIYSDTMIYPGHAMVYYGSDGGRLYIEPLYTSSSYSNYIVSELTALIVF